jgi:CheY-like chemotaxis protein
MTEHVSHVMVVEDDQDTRDVLRTILELEGMVVTEARDGLEALQRLEDVRKKNPQRPCVILLDVMMPRCSGPEFRQRQLAEPLLADVPVILLSAIADHPTVRAVDAFAVLPKPFDPEDLVGIVRRACADHQHQR